MLRGTWQQRLKTVHAVPPCTHSSWSDPHCLARCAVSVLSFQHTSLVETGCGCNALIFGQGQGRRCGDQCERFACCDDFQYHTHLPSHVCIFQVDSLRYDLEGYGAAVAAKAESEAVAASANRARLQAEERLRTWVTWLFS